jgi:integrase
MNIKLKHIRRERSGLFSYRRAIPFDLQEHYDGKRFITESLRTHDPGLAMNVAMALANRDDDRWANLRPWKPRSPEQIAAESKHLLRVIQKSRTLSAGPTFSRARDEYLKKVPADNKRARNEIALSWNFAQKIIGDRPMSDIRRTDGKTILEAMMTMGWKTATIRRRLSVLSAIFNTGVLEFELESRNPFSSLTIPGLLRDAKDIRPFTETELQTIAAECLLDGEAGLIAGLQLLTGMRVSEAAYLQITDIDLAAPIPHIFIRENTARGLKNAASARKIPLVSLSLQAGRVALQLATGPGQSSPWLFPVTAGHGSNAASKRVNSWLKKVLGGHPHSHQFRHSCETRLRNVGVPQPVINAILGHAGKDKISEGYFGGYDLAVLQAALQKIVIRQD